LVWNQLKEIQTPPVVTTDFVYVRYWWPEWTFKTSDRSSKTVTIIMPDLVQIRRIFLGTCWVWQMPNGRKRKNNQSRSTSFSLTRNNAQFLIV